MTFFKIEFHRDGKTVKAFEVPANACRGLMEVPDFQRMCEHMPPKYWPAIQRESWWADKHRPQEPLRLDMKDRKGNSLGTLYAVNR